MAGRLSDKDIEAIMNYRFGLTLVAPPSTHWLGLSTTQPTSSGGNITEVTGGSYSRVQAPNNYTTWPATVGRANKSNAIPFTFPTATASWGTPTWFILFDAVTAGLMRAYGPITNPVQVLSGATPSFPIGSLVISAPSS